MKYDKDYYKTLDESVQKRKAKEIKRFLKPDMNVLEVGCGDGSLTRLLSENCKYIIGIDLSEEALKIAREQQVKNTHYFDFDLFEYGNGLKNEDLFDCVVCMDVIEHISYDRHDEVLKKLWSFVKPGGLLLFGTSPIKDNFFHARNVYEHGETGDDEFRLSKRQVVELMLRNGFRVEAVKLFDTYAWFPRLKVVKGDTFLTKLPFVGKGFAAHVLVVGRKVVE